MEQNDNISQERIERRIADLAAKKCLMAQWDARRARAASGRRIRAWYATAAAFIAVMLLCLGVSILIVPPKSVPARWDDSAWRGGFGTEEVVRLMRAADFDRALATADSLLADTAVDPALPREQQQYVRLVLADRSYSITWLKINILATTGRKAEAREALAGFVLVAGEYQADAQALLDQL